MGIFFTSDFHLGHANIIKYCDRPFASAEEMDRTLLANVNDAVGPGDTLYFLGDFCGWSGGEAAYLKRAAEYRRRIRCETVVLIWGNHDRRLDGFAGLFQGAYDLLEIHPGGEHIVLCHYAMRVWNKSHRGSWQLYGHDHGRLPELPGVLAFDAGVDPWGFRPLSLAEVAGVMRRKRDVGAAASTGFDQRPGSDEPANPARLAFPPPAGADDESE